MDCFSVIEYSTWCMEPADQPLSGLHSNQEMIRDFYTAFQAREAQFMQQCYHSEASFYDPVFQSLKSNEVKAMWEMLIKSATDLTIAVSEIKATEHQVTCRWDAYYTFSKTGRKVHNIIQASFQFKDGKIVHHHDSFNFWRWSRQALGLIGLLLGWSSFVQNKVRTQAKKGLQKFMEQNNRQYNI